jgi:hypothetical protein
MVAVQTSYPTTMPHWPGEGFEPHMAGYNNVTGIVETAAGIAFGRAVSQGTLDKQVILGGTKFRGITVLDQFRAPTVAIPVMDKYLYRENCAVKTLGPIVVKNNSGGAVAAGDEVFYDPATGLFANTKGAVAVAAPTFSGTGNGVLTRATPAYGAGNKSGPYLVRFVEAAADAGRFNVLDPDLDVVGEGNVGVLFDGPVRFTIADGATDFIVGDTFTLLASTAAEGPIPGARWETAAADQALAIVHLGIQK